MIRTAGPGANWHKIVVPRKWRTRTLTELSVWCEKHESQYMYSSDYYTDHSIFWFQGKKDAVFFQLKFC